jgi:hypothetical protein
VIPLMIKDRNPFFTGINFLYGYNPIYFLPTVAASTPDEAAPTGVGHFFLDRQPFVRY